MSEKTLYQPELPPYEVCIKSSYTKEDINKFKKELEMIEKELSNIENKDIRKPQLRRQAADLEEIIINYENTESKPEIVESLNNNIKILSEYVELEKTIDYTTTLQEKLKTDNSDFFTKGYDCLVSATDFGQKVICKNDINKFIDFLQKKFPVYSCEIEKDCMTASDMMFQSKNYGNNTFNNLRYFTNNHLAEVRNEASKNRTKLRLSSYEEQLKFNKNLLKFVENIIIEKKKMEDNILELESNINNIQSTSTTQEKQKQLEEKILELENKISTIINEKQQIEDKNLQLENRLDNIILVLHKFGVCIN